jgi:hypothetical protein
MTAKTKRTRTKSVGTMTRKRKTKRRMKERFGQALSVDAREGRR